MTKILIEKRVLDDVLSCLNEDRLDELSNALLMRYRKKAKKHPDRWIGRKIAKAKITGKRDPEVPDETNIRIRGT